MQNGQSMILDIRFKDGPPRQFQYVRMTTVYTNQDFTANPELVIHFYDNLYPQMNIPLHRITCFTTTND